MQLTNLPLALNDENNSFSIIDDFLSQSGPQAQRTPMRLLFMPYGQGVYMAFVLKDWSEVQVYLNETDE